MQTIGRSATGAQQPKLREIVHADLWHYDAIESKLSGFDDCFFCLGVSSAGMNEADYERVTYGITVGAAEALCRLNPQMTFIYVSGAATDSSEHGRTMWARVKGKTENALLRLPFAAAYMFRPGIIEPVHGVTSKTPGYRFFLRDCQTVAAVAAAGVPEIYFDDARDWIGDALCDEAGLSETRLGDTRYARRLEPMMASAATRVEIFA